MIPQQIFLLHRHILALLTGVVGGLIPNNKSNINPLLMGFILSILLTKIAFGDYDKGYQWSFNDIWFVLIVGGEGALGAFIGEKLFG